MKPESQAGIYLQAGRVPHPYHAYNSAYNPVSRQDSELQSLRCVSRSTSKGIISFVEFIVYIPVIVLVVDADFNEVRPLFLFTTTSWPDYSTGISDLILFSVYAPQFSKFVLLSHGAKTFCPFLIFSNLYSFF